MSLYNGPPRPGARGGRDQFSWDNVKADKDREYYLGHSVKALAGRWQKGRDVYWYTREKEGQATIQEEVQAVKQREEELMMEALGLKPKTVVKPAPQLDKHDLEELIKGKQDEQEQPDDAGAAAQEADRIKGLGYIAGPGGGQSEAVHTTLPGMGPAGPGAHAQRLPPPPPLPGAAAAAYTGGRPGAAMALASGMTTAQLKELRKAEKRARKGTKKEAKKAKKEAKRAKKEAKKARRDVDGTREQQQAGERKSRRRHSASGSSSSSDGSSSDSDGGGRPRGRASEPGLDAAAVRHRTIASRPGASDDKAPHQVARGIEGEREKCRERDMGWERDEKQERGQAGAGGYERPGDPATGARRHGGDPDPGEDYGRQPMVRARHDSASPRPRRGASSPQNGQMQQQRRTRHDSPGRGSRRSRSRSRSPPERSQPGPEPRVGPQTGRTAWGRQGPYEDDAARADPRRGRDKGGAGVAGNAGGRDWREDKEKGGDRARSPRGRRHDSPSPGPRRREGRSRSPGDGRAERADDGRGGGTGKGRAAAGEEGAAAKGWQRDRRHDSRSPDRGRIRGR